MITVIRLAGPLLAWPSPAKYRHRQTEAGPTLSALQGLLAAAIGNTRSEPRPAWITEVAMAVRLDHPGSVLREFHTINPVDQSRYRLLTQRDRKKVRTVVTAEGGVRKDPVVTERYYRQDQTSVVFIDDPEGVAFHALSEPVFTLYAGRKACVLSFPVVLGQRTGTLEQALAATPSGARGTGPMEAILFSPPNELDAYKPTVSRPERPAGSVGDVYLMQDRYSVLVDPPRMASWLDALASLGPEGHPGGDAHVAV